MKKFLLMLVLGAFFYSCNDDETRINWDEPDPNYHAKEFLQDTKESLKQEHKINTADLPVTITLKEGVKITIPQNAFTKNGQPITGEFTVEAYEMLKPSSMIFSGTNTNYYNGSYFESDGFIFIDVKQNGVSVDQQLNAPVTISIPTDKEDGTFTQLWKGNEESGDNDDQFAWEDPEKDDFVEVGQEERGVFSNNKQFEFLIGKLGWINCDISWNSTNGMTTIRINLYGQFDKLASYLGYEGDTFVFFRAKGVLVLVQIYTADGTNTVKSYDNGMPIGAEGKLVAYSVKEGKFSYDEKEITITADMSIDLDLKDISKDDLEKNIKALDTYE
ncbi:hypothetical protein GGR21_003381 [Dysgonomonas hofstadii]|uniref:Uncharacterized protein n=1 Tax=Dysgonomonas hofstadii TaxID=637886 RepID=A0A840CUV7_9BACT|nr:hypothetical protein [Dysgonomonas hofstadii]MBB4037464.1 hypothetical protein [Dysgonomonas hofstadii]